MSDACEGLFHSDSDDRNGYGENIYWCGNSADCYSAENAMYNFCEYTTRSLFRYEYVYGWSMLLSTGRAFGDGQNLPTQYVHRSISTYLHTRINISQQVNSLPVNRVSFNAIIVLTYVFNAKNVHTFSSMLPSIPTYIHTCM